MTFRAKHKNRTLKWMFTMSQAEIKTCLTDKMYLLHVTTFQLGILLNFNEMEKFSIRDLITATGLQENEILKVRLIISTEIR